jgi:hypothetical protein
MFIGHFAAGFAGKAAAPRGSLAAYFAAAQLPDLIWPVLVLAGVERVAIVPGLMAASPLLFESYPISHSLVMDLLWAAFFGALVLWRTRNGRAAATAAVLVVSHWVLDVASHGKDMPLLPVGGPRYGLGLWNSLPATLIVELAMFAAGTWLYVQATRPRGPSGRTALVVLVAVLLAAYLGNALSGAPPPSVSAIAAVGLAGGALLLLLAMWCDRERTERLPPTLHADGGSMAP